MSSANNLIAAVVTRLTIAMRRMGVPREKLELLHQVIMDGKTVLILHCGAEDPVVLQQLIKWYGAESVQRIMQRQLRVRRRNTVFKYGLYPSNTC